MLTVTFGAGNLSPLSSLLLLLLLSVSSLLALLFATLSPCNLLFFLFSLFLIQATVLSLCLCLIFQSATLSSLSPPPRLSLFSHRHTHSSRCCVCASPCLCLCLRLWLRPFLASPSLKSRSLESLTPSLMVLGHEAHTHTNGRKRARTAMPAAERTPGTTSRQSCLHACVCPCMRHAAA